jgi:hypothetical protein
MQCLLCRKGLFIPLNDHIEAYCKTQHFMECRQLTLHAANPPQFAGRNRRNHERVLTCHPVTLVGLAGSPSTASSPVAAHEHPGIHGTTLDLSKGGMRLLIDRFVAQDTCISFSFENSFPSSIKKGEGQIAWCRARARGPGYTAGIAFRGDYLMETMGLYLGILPATPPAAN